VKEIAQPVTTEKPNYTAAEQPSQPTQVSKPDRKADDVDSEVSSAQALKKLYRGLWRFAADYPCKVEVNQTCTYQYDLKLTEEGDTLTSEFLLLWRAPKGSAKLTCESSVVSFTNEEIIIILRCDFMANSRMILKKTGSSLEWTNINTSPFLENPDIEALVRALGDQPVIFVKQ
jgi:hypothetical protein